MDNWASPLAISLIVLSIILLIITFLLYRKGIFFFRKQASLVLLVGDFFSSLKHLRTSDATLGSDDALEDGQQYVHVPSLNRETLERLLVSHPGVTNLNLSASRLTSLTATRSLILIGDLLDGWKSSLLSLKLILHFTHITYDEAHRQMAPNGSSDLLGVINRQLTSLEHLTLSSNTRLLPHGAFHLSILRRLRSFTIATKDPVSWLSRSFANYAALNEALECIQMENSIDAESAYPGFTDALWNKFTHLKVAYWLLDEGVLFAEFPLMTVFPHLLGLKFLSLGAHFCGSNQYRDLMASLTLLRQLTTLDLKITSDGGSTLQGEEEPHRPDVLPVLANIRRLSLHITSEDHEVNQVGLFSIDTIFPRLDVLAIHFYLESCADAACDYEHDGPPVPAHVMHHCAAQLYQQVAQVAVGRKEVTFQWKEPKHIWTAAQLAIQE